MITNINGYQAYQKNKYETASPHRLITMLYEGAIRYTNQAIKLMHSDDISGSNAAIQRAQDIVYELISCLNFDQGKEIAENLNALYTYTIELYVKGNIEKNINHLEEANGIISELKSAWEQMGKETKLSHG
ncbi:flagellar export chaperone FliS [Paenibacillus sp. FSL W7-1287]|uniref:flagellar export chaperone FliS n=1 Tax=Paenibacillus sp. FSL W7-1287 TaxID=2954538 RepID=UPI0030F9D337